MHKLAIRKRLLLVGPPGMGKSAICEAIGQRCGSKILFLSAAAIPNTFKNSGVTRLNQIFKILKESKEQVFLILDELTGLTDRHGNVNNADVGVIEYLQTLLDECDLHYPNIIVLATVNSAKRIPKALVSRFGKIVTIDKINTDLMLSIMKRKLKGLCPALDNDVSKPAFESSTIAVATNRDIFLDHRLHGHLIGSDLPYSLAEHITSQIINYLFFKYKKYKLYNVLSNVSIRDINHLMSLSAELALARGREIIEFEDFENAFKEMEQSQLLITETLTTRFLDFIRQNPQAAFSMFLTIIGLTMQVISYIQQKNFHNDQLQMNTQQVALSKEQMALSLESFMLLKMNLLYKCMKELWMNKFLKMHYRCLCDITKMFIRWMLQLEQCKHLISDMAAHIGDLTIYSKF